MHEVKAFEVWLLHIHEDLAKNLDKFVNKFINKNHGRVFIHSSRILGTKTSSPNFTLFLCIILAFVR